MSAKTSSKTKVASSSEDEKPRTKTRRPITPSRSKVVRKVPSDSESSPSSGEEPEVKVAPRSSKTTAKRPVTKSPKTVTKKPPVTSESSSEEEMVVKSKRETGRETKKRPPVVKPIEKEEFIPTTRETVISSTDKKWLAKLRALIKDMLVNILPEKDVEDNYLTPEAMTIWVRAFTDESYDHSYNYEPLEYMGDAVLKSLFAKYLERRFRNLEEEQFTNLNNYYMSKMEQGKISQRYKFSNYVRVRDIPPNNLSVDADLFESFFGALQKVSDGVSDYLGFLNCGNMLTYMFQDIDIDMVHAEGTDRTIVDQIFSRLGIGPVKGIANAKEDQYVIFITSKQAKILSKYATKGEVSQAEDEISGTGKTKTSAKIDAYTNLRRYLEDRGLDKETAKTIKRQKDLDDLGSSLAKKVMDKATSQGYDSVSFYSPTKKRTKEGSIIQLLGIKGTSSDILASMFIPGGRELDRNIEIANKYVSTK